MHRCRFDPIEGRLAPSVRLSPTPVGKVGTSRKASSIYNIQEQPTQQHYSTYTRAYFNSGKMNGSHLHRHPIQLCSERRESLFPAGLKEPVKSLGLNYRIKIMPWECFAPDKNHTVVN